MRVQFSSPVLALVTLAAGCGGGGSNPQADGSIDSPKVVDAPQVLDAPAGRFDCLGAALPTTAPDPLTIAGTAKTLNGLSTANAAGVLVEAYRTGTATAVTSVTSGADGKFSLSVTSAGTPLTGYVKATKAGLLDYYLFPGAPIAVAIPDAPVLVLSAASLSTVETLASVTPAANPNSVGLVAVAIQDCDGAAVPGATISVQENGAEVGDKRYVAGSLPSTTATVTDAKGAAFVFNVPVGTVTVTAHVGGMTLRTHSFPVVGGASHATIVVP